MGLATSLLARSVKPRIVLTTGPGYHARTSGYLWWRRVEISTQIWDSRYRDAVLEHELYHAENWHNETAVLVSMVWGIALIFCVATQNWGRGILLTAAMLGLMIAWSWWREFAADVAAVRAGHGPDLADLLARLEDGEDGWMTHPPSPVRVNYLNWFARNYG